MAPWRDDISVMPLSAVLYESESVKEKDSATPVIFAPRNRLQEKTSSSVNPLEVTCEANGE